MHARKECPILAQGLWNRVLLLCLPALEPNSASVLSPGNAPWGCFSHSVFLALTLGCLFQCSFFFNLSSNKHTSTNFKITAQLQEQPVVLQAPDPTGPPKQREKSWPEVTDRKPSGTFLSCLHCIYLHKPPPPETILRTPRSLPPRKFTPRRRHIALWETECKGFFLK